MKTTQTTVNTLVAAEWIPSTSRSGFGFVLNNSAGKILAQGIETVATPKMLVSSTTSVNDGNWHHVALNFDTANGGANALFIDGTQEATATSLAAWPLTFVGHLVLGGPVTFWANYNGDLAEVAQWTRQLDAAEINALAKAFSPSNVATSSLIFLAPLVRPVRDLYGRDPTVTGAPGASAHCRVFGAVI